MAKRYLSLCSLESALALMKTSFRKVERSESVRVTGSLGRIVAAPVYAPYAVPEVNLAAMDGYAIASRDTVGAYDQAPVTLVHYVPINTGNVLPAEFDAVIMYEETWEDGESIQIRKPAVPWQNVHKAGEDIRENQLVLAEGDRIRAFDIGALTTYGISFIDVRTVKVGLIPTGSELVPAGTRPAPGQVVESNTTMAKAFLEELGATCTRYPIVRDYPDKIERALSDAVRENDFVIISAGSSAGTRDFTEEVISRLGELLFHGVAMRPGKPMMLGRIEGKPVLGLPGFPTAAQTVLREFAAPLLESWGLPALPDQKIQARLAHALTSDLGFDEFIQVSVGRIGPHYWAVPHSRGSGAQMTTVRANAYIHIPACLEGFEAGTEIETVSTTDKERIDKTLIVCGVYEPVVHELELQLRRHDIFLRMRNSGNTGAILSLTRNSCHAALMWLPDFSLLRECRDITRLIPFSDLAFIHIATIVQGIASREGLDMTDLPHVRFVNREKGSATRAIFDALLNIRGVKPSQVEGYHREVTSPLAVATAIRDGFADAGMCSSVVAEECGLSFVPITGEEYKLVIRRELLDDPKIRVLLAEVVSPSFIDVLSRMEVYDTSRTGAIHYLSENFTVTETSLTGSFPS